MAKGNKVPLLGRNWLEHIKLNWSEIFSVHHMNPVKDLVLGYDKLFEEGEGRITDIKAHITLKEQAKPVFRRARPVPYALKKPLEDKLDALEREGILIKVDHSSWASPVVLVPKPDKSIRMCGDYKVSINPWVKTDGYPLPTVQDLFATLAGGKVFTKIDLKQAYQQLEVDEKSQEFLMKACTDTQDSLLGVSNVPSIFQAAMDKIPQDVKNSICYLDDTLISGANEVEHI